MLISGYYYDYSVSFLSFHAFSYHTMVLLANHVAVVVDALFLHTNQERTTLTFPSKKSKIGKYLSTFIVV